MPGDPENPGGDNGVADRQPAQVQRMRPDMNLQPPDQLRIDSDRAENFRRFRSRWESYSVLARLADDTPEYQKALFLYTVGVDAARVIETSPKYVHPTAEAPVNVKLMLGILEQFCIGETNTIHERYKFNTRNQLPNESFETYYSELRAQSAKCSFTFLPAGDGRMTPLDELIRDRIVLGIRDDSVRKKLISTSNTLTLTKAVDICRTAEMTTAAMKSIGVTSTGGISVNAVRRSNDRQHDTKPNQANRNGKQQHKKPPFPSSNTKGSCQRCGKAAHDRQHCPARDADCRECGKKGHYAKMCRSKRLNEVRNEDEEFVFLGEVDIGEVNSCCQAEILVNDNPTKFKLDTGADSTVISDSEPWLVGVTLKRPKSQLYGPGHRRLDVVGMLSTELKHHDQVHSEVAYVIRNQAASLLSRKACFSLGLLTSNIEEVISVEDEYPELYKGLGNLRDVNYEISVNPESTPTCIYTPRTIALPLREKVQNKLAEMENQGVISKVDQPTEWCSGLVVVPKPSGDVRLCVDLTGLNKAVRREVHPMATVEDSLAKLSGSRVFSKLDANSGFWQIELAPKSRLLTTFLTPFGRYCYNRLPFGISSAPEIFQRAMSRVLLDVPDVVCHMDDVMVHGKDEESHDKMLKMVLGRLKKSGITLNRAKCVYRQKEINFLGHVISGEGVALDPQKAEAIKNYPTPTCQQDLRRLNGMLNQMSRYIPGLATINQPMRELLKSNCDWIWEEPQRKAFNEIKRILSSAQVMAHYDPKLPTVLSTDASNSGLGAALYQMQGDGSRRPVYYASRSLTETESRYATIEKEALAVVWACEKLDKYLCGMDFSVETDHKPLVPLLSTTSLDKVPPRILRMRLRLMKYAPAITHVAGKANQTADALSRAPLTTTESHFLVGEIESYVTVCFPRQPLFTKVQKAQQEDAVCQELKHLLRYGWPAYKTDANTAIHPYWDQRHHLTVGPDEILLSDRRLLIPATLRVEMLERVHAAHQGVVKCQERARQLMWWPMMSTQIREMVEACQMCRAASKTPVEPLMPSTLPDRPWERVAADLFEFEKQHFLLLIDYYSRWIEVRELGSLSSQTTIQQMKAVFATHGVPDMVVSDNGPQFASKEFHDFTDLYGFCHVTSSPRYPRGNGEAERAVGTVKKLWKKSTDRDMSLLLYRTTPLANGFSPAELLMGRLIRGNLPATAEHLQPAAVYRDNIVEHEERNRQMTKTNYDTRHRAKSLPALKHGDPVTVRDSGAQAVVQGQAGPRSYVITTSKKTLRRNRSALISTEVPGMPNAMVNQSERPTGCRSKNAVQGGAEVPGIPTATANQPERAVSFGGAEVHGSPTANPASPKTDTRPRRLRRRPHHLDDYVLT